MGPIRRLIHLSGALLLLGVLAVGVVPRGNVRAQSVQANSVFHLSAAWSAQAQLNPFAPNAISGFAGLTDNPLAYFVRATFSYRPALALNWQTSSHQIVVNLRHGVVWHDNQPFTSKDVVTTFLAGSTLGWQIWNQITGVRARGLYQVVFDLRPHVVVSDALYQLLIQMIYPDHVWGQYLPKNIAALAASGNSAALSKANQDLIKAGPATWVGTGPFQITAVGPAQIVMTKFPAFWNASRIHVSSIMVNQALDNQSEWGQMLSGWTDFGWDAAPPTVQTQWLSKPDNHIQLPWDYSIYAVYFNSRRYPMTIPAFRQALAYLIDRPTVTKIADPVNVADQVPTGLLPPVAQQWIDPAVMKTLNPYNHDPAKAAALLTGAGFKKTSAGWMAPNGQPIKLTLSAPAGWTTSVILMEAIAAEMKQFGFNDVVATSGAQPGYWTDQSTGNFDIQWGWAGWWDLNPVHEFYSLFVNQNYDPRNPQNKGLGFGPSVQMAGYGTVNLAQFLKKLSATDDKAQIVKAVSALAKLENDQVPMLPVEVKRIQNWYSSRNFTNWPGANNPLWSDIGGWAPSALSLMMQDGYIVPR